MKVIHLIYGNLQNHNKTFYRNIKNITYHKYLRVTDECFAALRVLLNPQP